MDNLDDTTEVRIVRDIARGVVSEEIRGLAQGIRTEMRLLFKLNREEMHKDLANWVIKINQGNDTKIRELLKDHVTQDHKISVTPAGRVSIIPRGRLTVRQKVSIVVVGLTVVGAAIKAFWG